MSTETAEIIDLKYVKNFANGRADMFIHTHIGHHPTFGPGIMSQDFVQEMQHLVEHHHVQQINVHINSPGGSVLEAIGIFSAIMNSKALVHTYIDGVAASSAGWIFLAGRMRFMNDFSRLMVHDVAAPAGTDSQAITAFREMVIEVISNNTGKTKEEVASIMKAETWYNAVEALQENFTDQIINTNRNLRLATNDKEDLQAIYNACDELIQIENSNNNQNQLKMLDITNELGLQEGADEKTVLKAVKEIKNQVKTDAEAKTTAETALETANTKIADLERENASLKSDATKAGDAAAIEFVDNLVKTGKITEDKKDAILVSAKADLEGVKNIFDAMPEAHADITNTIAAPAAGAPSTAKTLREMEKEDPSGLEKIKNGNLALYKTMYKAEYNTEYIG